MNKVSDQRFNYTGYLMTWLLLLSFEVMANETDRESVKPVICPFSELTESTQSQADRLSIEKVMADWKKAVQQVDFDTLGSLVTADAEFWTHGAKPLVGREALVAAFEPFLAEYEMNQQFACQELIITGDWAFIRGLEVNELKDRVSGEIRISKQRAFSVLQQDGQGQWRFARGMTNRPPNIKQRIK